MIQQNIKDIIDKNNQKIEELLTPGTFILNQEIYHLQQENASLRAQCKHEFINGFCKWCGLPEEYK
jgi:hypothetical protein